jgi:hypothetical protein
MAGIFKRWREAREARDASLERDVQAEYQALVAGGADPDDAADAVIEKVKAKLSLMDFLAFIPKLLEILRSLRDLFPKSS